MDAYLLDDVDGSGGFVNKGLGVEGGTAAESVARLCFVAAAPYAIQVFLKKQLLRLVDEGYSVTVCTDLKQLGGDRLLLGSIRVIDIPIERKISLLKDIATLIRLILFFRRERFDVVHSLLPKSGLLSMIAARLTGIKVRIHTFTGQVWTTSVGIQRVVLKTADRTIAACASQLLADSFSQSDFLVAEKIVPAEKIRVLANGSMCGVDLQRFMCDPLARSKVRERYCIDEMAVVILFVGRMTKEKGIFELLKAFHELREGLSGKFDIYLMLVGPDDGGITKSFPVGHGINYLGHSSEIQQYFSAADIYCLPSYREGFGSVLIEAAAAGLPVVATRIYGITDATVAEETALLVEPRDVMQLRNALERLIKDGSLRKSMGERGKVRVQKMFSEEIVCAAWSDFYKGMFA